MRARVIENLGTVDVPMRVHRTTQQSVYRRILQAGKEGIGFHELGKRFSGMDRDKLHKLVDNLVSSGEVDVEFVKTGEPGRPPRILRAKEHVKK